MYFIKLNQKGEKNLVLNIILKLKQSMQTQEVKGDYCLLSSYHKPG